MKTNIRLLKNTQKYRRTLKGVLTNMYDHMRKRHLVNFTLIEFHNKYLNDKCFIRLHNNWVKSNFNIQLKPSLDRTNCKLPYTFENTTMMTWSENRLKQSKIDGKMGRKFPVLQLVGDKIIKRFQSQRHVVAELGISQSNLSSVLNGKRKHINGYKFIYEYPELLTTKEQQQ
jgi:hypothetical protein